MIISYQWLKQYVDLKVSPEEVADVLTQLGLEVEAVESPGSGLQKVVSALVESCEPHPEADRLSLCRVNDGEQTYPVVCGAPNVKAGQKVVLAQVGALLPGNFKIKKSKIRGCESLGMICAEDELGLGSDHSGILELPEDTPVGTPVADLDLFDTTFDVGITPNRPDALCHLGIARELAGHYGLPLKIPQVKSLPNQTLKNFQLKVEAPQDCSLYIARKFTGLRVDPSPDWLAKALESVGQKSINNVVDATNYVLLAFGQPSHAFDGDVLEGQTLCIRRAAPDETLLTLDESELKLTSEDLVIADGRKPQCLAGVMGGLHSGVTEKTQTLLLEVAYFLPSRIRGASKRHNLSSDASYRFERGVDPLHLSWICDYLTQLLVEVAGAKVEGTLVQEAPEHPKSPRKINLRLPRLRQVLGIDIDVEEARKLLENIQLTSAIQKSVDQKLEETLEVTIPGFRPDLEREVDLIEEVARLYNYNNIPVTLPRFTLVKQELPKEEVLQRKIRHYLAAQGFNECISLRFHSLEDVSKLGLKPEEAAPVRLQNPLHAEAEVMPVSLLPALLKAMDRNLRNQEKTCRFFEVGKVFVDQPKSRDAKHPGVLEEERLAILFTGPWELCSWEIAGGGSKKEEDANVQADYYGLKGQVENLLDFLKVPVAYGTTSVPYLHPGESLGMYIDNKEAGWFGALHPGVLDRYGISHPCFYAELKLDALKPRPASFEPYSHHPTVTRDMNILVDEGVRHGQILSWMPLDRVKFLESAHLNSVYQGEGIAAGKKAMHYSFIYRHPTRALTDEEVNKIQSKIARVLEANPEIAFK